MPQLDALQVALVMEKDILRLQRLSTAFAISDRYRDAWEFSNLTSSLGHQHPITVAYLQ